MLRNVQCLIAVLLGFALMPAATPAETASPRERIERLEKGLLAPCCYSESLFRHSSEVARKMRAEIAQWVAEGKSDREILDTYKKQYGARVLAEPEGSTWWWSVVVPCCALALGMGIAIVVVRRWRRAPRAQPAQALPEGFTLPDIDDE